MTCVKDFIRKKNIKNNIKFLDIIKKFRIYQQNIILNNKRLNKQFRDLKS